ncbi:hypothetical protein ENHY17A_100165 [Moraxellaceae bacterium 17A]|nr:hypothetical protein ENHY17A_100165 [Moraxellaceae bacterium 17A]
MAAAQAYKYESGLIAITCGRDISADSGAAQLSLEKAITAKYARGDCLP